MRGWWEIAHRIRREMVADNIFVVSAGVAFFALLAIFPVLAALVSLYGLISNRGELNHHLHALDHFMQMNLSQTLAKNLHSVVGGSGFALSIGVIISLTVALWATIRGMVGLICALNVIYDEEEERSLPRLIFTAVVLSIGALIFWLIVLVAVVALPAILAHLTDSLQAIVPLIGAIRWIIITVTLLASTAILYRFGPSHTQPRWEWLSYGSVIATLLWLAGSACLSYYIAHFGSINRIYGSLGAVIILQVWFFLTAFIFLLGAEINIEMQRQTHRDVSA